MKHIPYLLMAFIGTTGFAAETMERFFERNIDVIPGFTFSLDAHKGHIQIRTDPSSTTLEIRARYYIDQDQYPHADPEVMENFEIAVRESNGYVHVEARRKKEWHGMYKSYGDKYPLPMVEFDILLPDDASLEIDSHKSSFDVEAPRGQVQVDSHKGSGTIVGVRDELNLDTHKGNFKITIEQLNDLDIDTHKGDVYLTIKQAKDFSVHGDSHKGEFRFYNRDIRVKREDRHEMTVTYSEGRPENRVRLSTHKGKIVMDFQD